MVLQRDRYSPETLLDSMTGLSVIRLLICSPSWYSSGVPQSTSYTNFNDLVGLIEDRLWNGCQVPVSDFVRALDLCEFPVQTRKIVELTSCYVPINRRHLVIEQSIDAVFRIEHLSLFSDCLSLGSCLGLLESIMKSRISLDKSLVAHLSDGEAVNRFWPLLACAGYGIDHRWTRFWSSEQMTLAISLYADNTNELSRLSSITLNGWSPGVFESSRILTAPLAWHIQRAANACESGLSHLSDVVVSSIVPQVLHAIPTTDKTTSEYASKAIALYDTKDIQRLLTGPHAGKIAILVAEALDAGILATLEKSEEALDVLSSTCAVDISLELLTLAAALTGPLTVRDKLTAAQALLT